MYKVQIQARMDILGEVIDRFTVQINEYTSKKEAKKQAVVTAHKEKCQKYGLPVHFVATSCSNWR